MFLKLLSCSKENDLLKSIKDILSSEINDFDAKSDIQKFEK